MPLSAPSTVQSERAAARGARRAPSNPPTQATPRQRPGDTKPELCHADDTNLEPRHEIPIPTWDPTVSVGIHWSCHRAGTLTCRFSSAWYHRRLTKSNSSGMRMRDSAESWSPGAVASEPNRVHTPASSPGVPGHTLIEGAHGCHLLDDWLAWASRSKLKPFVDLARKIRRHRPAIENMLEHDLSNALVESTNTKIRLLMRMAFGFKDTDALISLAMLALGGYRPDLPGRSPA